MDDKLIITLFFNRDETAITKTHEKYGKFCHTIANNILNNTEDTEECLNDTYHTAWNQIPPTTPISFKAFLGKITRNIAISRYRSNHTKKHYNKLTILLSELNDCIPSSSNVESVMEQRHISDTISKWLDSLSDDDCALFVRRYWYGDEVKLLAKETGYTANQMAWHMLKLRKSLKAYLEAEGVVI